ncbi:hypothetical protein SAMN04488056_101576 [Cohaesibacter marisflavi]|uniref:Uncharacterized protein n=1 Tax=Cohaesibacter marisflavi TaxID=655353 RepID=A0A1I5AQL5_9HYPH|nr:hypothetical protein SAMN04488056_101576 [Cohaesibacter marisflavi]
MTSPFLAAVNWCGFLSEQMQFALRPLEACAAVFPARAHASSYSLARLALKCAGNRRTTQRPHGNVSPSGFIAWKLSDCFESLGECVAVHDQQLE